MKSKAVSNIATHGAANARLRTLAFVHSVRADLIEGRAAWAKQRTLQRELASYSTVADVHDLLGSARRAEGAYAEQTRAAVAGNLGRDRLAS